MSIDTLKPKAVYGIKAYAENRENLDSTSMLPGNRIDIKMGLRHGDYVDSGFLKVNFSDQQKRKLYRKINKMLGGY